MKKIIPSLLLIFVFTSSFLLLVGCPGLGGKSIQDMSPKEKVTWMMSVYNSQYRDYRNMTGYTQDIDGRWIKTSTPSLTDEQKTTLRNRKAILSEAYPLIKIYDSFVSSGKVPDQETEDKIIQLLNSLM